MERFAQMLKTGFTQAGLSVELWRPVPFFGRIAKSTNSGIGKWVGYIDKWIIFPIILYCRLVIKSYRSSNTHFHICDHSNSPYLSILSKELTGITCHDVLAIRGALGFDDAYCPTSSTGKILQRWIFNNLIQAKKIASVSELTLFQLQHLSKNYNIDRSEWRVIHNAFNSTFYPMAPSERALLLGKVGLKPNEPYILHVGSSLPRKNRKMLLNMVHAMGDQWKGRICFAGKAIDETLYNYVSTLGLENRIVSVVKPDHTTLIALYSACQAFIFPSFSEGFGWPVIEAQACGAPVIASLTDPMPEVSGGAALHADPYDPQTFASAFISLQNEILRNDLVERGFENCNRFKLSRMINDYLSLHGIEQEYYVTA
ncbi:glycosyltransferase family 1 protein [Spirosoma migulaei]